MYIIRNGTLVGSGGTWRADLGMEGGKIKAIAPGLASAPGDEVLDAAGMLVFPGFIDPHTHLDMDNGATTTADDFASGTLGAVCGGTTTLIDFATQDKGGSLQRALDAWHKKADGVSSCNYGVHMAVTDWKEETRRELRGMIDQGVTSIKVYLAYDALRVNDGELLDILRACRALGLQVGCHCENGDVINYLQAQAAARGELGPWAHPATRPAWVEAEAISRYCRVAQAADCPVTVVHLSSAAGLEEVRAARKRGQTVWAETCPQYLVLDESRYRLPGFEGAKYVISPPLRPASDVAALRRAVADGEVDTIATDHCSFRFAGQKELGKADFRKIPNGAPGLEHRGVVFYSSFVSDGTLTPQRMCALLAENPARLYGMYPRKGVLREGADADVTVWDPAARWTITAQNQHHKVDYTPFEGMQVTGRAAAVFVNGVLAARDGEPVQTNAGRYVERKPLDHMSKKTGAVPQ